jgi:hypothetical protein
VDLAMVGGGADVSPSRRRYVEKKVARIFNRNRNGENSVFYRHLAIAISPSPSRQ